MEFERKQLADQVLAKLDDHREQMQAMVQKIDRFASEYSQLIQLVGRFASESERQFTNVDPLESTGRYMSLIQAKDLSLHKSWRAIKNAIDHL